ncbi:unnamed protein product [Linum trigynum]|uniref:Uncharacterized protein n=1 Tax=Linum trigynum TaxID=586398 RepID=A0AAV2CYD3_9ROSI
MTKLCLTPAFFSWPRFRCVSRPPPHSIPPPLPYSPTTTQSLLPSHALLPPPFLLCYPPPPHPNPPPFPRPLSLTQRPPAAITGQERLRKIRKGDLAGDYRSEKKREL